MRHILRLRRIQVVRLGLLFSSILMVGVLGARALQVEEGPLTVDRQGSFFVGGRDRVLASGDSITVDQMYVQYQLPSGTAAATPKPAIAMVHGCCLSSKSWEETPDGRMGWNEFFVRNGYPTYLAEQVTRGRSGFDATIFEEVRTGLKPPSALPPILSIGHSAAWTAFRFGPTNGTPFENGQFPVEAANEFYRQMIPDLNLMLGPYSGPNPTFGNLASLANQAGGAVIIGHSESGFFPQNAALADPTGIRGLVTIEPGGSCTPANPLNVAVTPEQIQALAKIPQLIIYGDNLSGGWVRSRADCHDVYLPQIEAAGGEISFVDLPRLGIVGNSHMMMLDRNNLEVAAVIQNWIEEHVK